MRYFDMKSSSATLSLLQTEKELREKLKMNTGTIPTVILYDAHTYLAEFIAKISEDMSNANGLDDPLSWEELSSMMHARKPVWRQIDRDYGEWMLITKMESNASDDYNIIWDHSGIPWVDYWKFFQREQKYYDDYVSI